MMYAFSGSPSGCIEVARKGGDHVGEDGQPFVGPHAARARLQQVLVMHRLTPGNWSMLLWRRLWRHYWCWIPPLRWSSA